MTETVSQEISQAQVVAAQKFLLACTVAAIEDARVLRELLQGVLGYEIAPPMGDRVTLEGVTYTLGYEPDASLTLRAVRPCEHCGDPVRSKPIRMRRHVWDWMDGRHDAAHACGWLSGE